jgi:hypothetical protein
MPTNGRPAAIDLPDYGSFLVEEVEIPGFSAFYYETSYEFEGRSVDLVLHPPEDENSDWTDFLAYAHKMIGDVLRNSDSIILSGSRVTGSGSKFRNKVFLVAPKWGSIAPQSPRPFPPASTP